MSETTRLGFIKSSAGAAAGLTVVGSLVAARKADAADGPVGSDSVVAYVKNPATGEISVMTGEREVIVHDRKLAARLSRAAG